MERFDIEVKFMGANKNEDGTLICMVSATVKELELFGEGAEAKLIPKKVVTAVAEGVGVFKAQDQAIKKAKKLIGMK